MLNYIADIAADMTKPDERIGIVLMTSCVSYVVFCLVGSYLTSFGFKKWKTKWKKRLNTIIGRKFSWKKKTIEEFRARLMKWNIALVKADYPGDIIKHIQTSIKNETEHIALVENANKLGGHFSSEHLDVLAAIITDMNTYLQGHFDKQTFSPTKSPSILKLLMLTEDLRTDDYGFLRILHIFEEAKNLQKKTEAEIRNAWFQYMAPADANFVVGDKVMTNNSNPSEPQKQLIVEEIVEGKTPFDLDVEL